MATYGRGGAGNIVDAKVKEINARVSQDLEANQQAADSHLADPEKRSTEPAPISQVAGGEAGSAYVNVGRGGAGNFVTLGDKANVLAGEPAATGRASGQFDASTTTAFATSASGNHRNSQQSQQHGYRPVGRGGAGNFYAAGEADAAEAEGQKKLQEKEEKELRGAIEGDVEQGLKKPAKAALGLGREKEL